MDRDDAEHARRHRDHQRKLITLRSGEPPADAPKCEHRVRGLICWLADPTRTVDVSDYELATLGGLTTDDVHAALASLASGGQVTVLPAPGNPGIRVSMCGCPQGCGKRFQSVHRRALELAVMDHLEQVHGMRLPVVLTPRRERTSHYATPEALARARQRKVLEMRKQGTQERRTRARKAHAEARA
jgi:hypothetical protein